MSEELKPCPFCGNRDIRRHQFGDFKGVPCCTECGVAVIGGDWNHRAKPAAQAVPEGWIKLIDYLPPLGKYVVLCKDGTVQRFSFYLDQADSDFAGGEYFWATDDVDMDEFPAADFERDYWMPIPAAPTPPAEEVEG